ncbi:hypothetical protein MEA186_20499 [Mesorhizobium amorphae CCNWGS0123]|uniref:Uncharacterized protein n=1 Tax=Mesorhizobium amorphae CCNWGS0123 TaxID=1082933 RepID=G6YDQ7_9HYPH|nr:hypothetical protein MEA186_20499 [Mesorhizobium amorphae CCNWGS0123]
MRLLKRLFVWLAFVLAAIFMSYMQMLASRCNLKARL